VQILVVVANVQARILKTVVEKGFALTAIVRKIVGPKRIGNTISNVEGDILLNKFSSEGLFINLSLNLPSSKGKQVKDPVP